MDNGVITLYIVALTIPSTVPQLWENVRPKMITLAPLTTQNVQLFKMVRLQALQDTPSAFNSTYARETLFADADWIAAGGAVGR